MTPKLKNSRISASLLYYWHEGGHFYPFIYFLDWILSAEFLSKLSKLFGGENLHQFAKLIETFKKCQMSIFLAVIAHTNEGYKGV